MAGASRQAVRARNGDLAVFAVNGLLFASWMARLPDVKQLLGLTPGQLGLLLLSLSAGAVIGLPAAGRVAHRLGAARTVRLGATVAITGMVLAAVAIGLGWPIGLASGGLLMFGLGTGVWDVAQNLQGSVIEQAVGRAIMPWFHAAFSIGTVAGALLGAAATYWRVPLGVHLPVMAVATAAVVLWGTGQFLPGFDDTHPAATAEQAPRSRSPWTERRTLVIGAVVLAAAFAEGTANDWLAVAFVDGHDVTPALGVLALAVFLTAMTLGRILGTGVLDRHGRVATLRVLFAAAVVGCLLVVFGGVPLAYVGAAVWGVGASLGFPVGMSAAADDPQRAALRLSVVSTIGYTAFLAGPPLLGFLGDHFGVLNALLAVGAASVLAILIAPATAPLVPSSAPPTPPTPAGR